MLRRSQNRAVFLDRDGVLIEDRGLLLNPCDLHILPGVPEALKQLHDAGFTLVVVSNQAVVARGLLSEIGMIAIQHELESELQALGAPPLDGFYYCPHHPAATLASYRMDCFCRKPRPGLLLQAAAALGLDLAESFMVGDRLTDLQAGHHAGCQAIWAQTGRHLDEPIETSERMDATVPVAFVCNSLAHGATWILEQP